MHAITETELDRILGTTFAYVEGRPFAPKGAAWEQALDLWRALPTDADATFDATVELTADEIVPTVTWGTNPAQSVSIFDRVPDPESFGSPQKREGAERSGMLYLVFADREAAGPGALRLAELIREAVKRECRKEEEGRA